MALSQSLQQKLLQKLSPQQIQLMKLLQVPTDGHDLGSLDFAVCGAAPMPGELARRFEQATGIRILEAYGLTESACVSTLNPKSDARRGLVAELRLRQSSPALRAALGSYALAAEITEG